MPGFDLKAMPFFGLALGALRVFWNPVKTLVLKNNTSIYNLCSEVKTEAYGELGMG